jgi:hypothetical protein
MRGPTEYGPQQAVTLEILSAGPEQVRGLLAAIRRLMTKRNVFRKQVLSFGEPTWARSRMTGRAVPAAIQRCHAPSRCSTSSPRLARLSQGG